MKTSPTLLAAIGVLLAAGVTAVVMLNMGSDPSSPGASRTTGTANGTGAAANDPTTVTDVEEGNIAGLPKMELEKLDQSIESARKVTTGIKSMMDGMGGLREMMQPPPPTGGK